MTSSAIALPAPGRDALHSYWRWQWRAAMHLLMLGMMLVVQGCATGPAATARDPFEPVNRKVSQFNDVVDGAIFKPAATAYQTVTPSFIRTGVSNFFGNISDAWSFVNTVAQLKPTESVDNLLRVTVNTFIGIGGLFDFASDMNIDRHPEDFGQTLGRWGVPSGPFVMLPILGPSTVRDALSISVDRSADPVGYIPNIGRRNSLQVLKALEIRANLLRATNVIEGAALDKYTFLRDAFLQRRRSDIYDGNPPDEDATDSSKSDDGKAK